MSTHHGKMEKYCGNTDRKQVQIRRTRSKQWLINRCVFFEKFSLRDKQPTVVIVLTWICSRGLLECGRKTPIQAVFVCLTSQHNLLIPMKCFHRQTGLELNNTVHYLTQQRCFTTVQQQHYLNLIYCRNLTKMLRQHTGTCAQRFKNVCHAPISRRRLMD